MLYQAFADGRTATHQLTTFVPETLRALQKRHAAGVKAAPAEA
jgi:hypothetical protein